MQEENVTDVYKSFYVIVPAANTVKSDKYIMLSTYYSGSGVDTIKNKEIIKNSANAGASATAALIELAKYFKENRHLLNKNLIIMFNRSNMFDYQKICFAQIFDKGTVEMCFDMYCLGYLRGYSGEGYYEYIVDKKIKNASKLLQPILLKDPDIPTYVSVNYDNDLPNVFISGDNLEKYEDVADSLNYDMMEKIVNQSKEVITAFAGNDLQLEESSAKEYQESKDAFYGDRYSYFGVNLMIGSNKHYYTEGRMTGKSAMSYSAGLFYKWQFSNAFSLKLDVNYERAFANRHDGRFASNVISVPLSVVFSPNGRSAGVDFGYGAYYDYNMSAKLNGNDVDWDDFKRGEWGWQWFFTFRAGHLIIGYYQKIGISDIMQDSFIHTGKIKNRNQYFVIGFAF